MHENRLIQYVRDKKGRPLGVLVALKVEDDVVRIGWSWRHRRDHFVKKIGLDVALARTQFDHIPGKAPREIFDCLEAFAERCCKFFKVDHVSLGCSVIVGSKLPDEAAASQATEE